MGDRSAIEWTDHTFNPWWGCVEVSPGCDHCYARRFAERTGHAIWGKDGPRRFFGDEHWNEPFRWHWRAEKAGVRERVFCASMADVLEERDDAVGRQLDEARQRLWFTILNTPRLDWLLLTKRPGAGPRLIPTEVQLASNLWVGTTVESQDYAWRVEKVREIGCAVRFLSVEPLLGPVDLRLWLEAPRWPATRQAVEWVIVGGESGGRPERALVMRCHGARVCYGREGCGRPGALHPKPEALRWVRALRDQCQAAEVPFFFKQWGGPTPKSGGCELDGQTWEEMPGAGGPMARNTNRSGHGCRPNPREGADEGSRTCQ
jgi:protein gp37